MNAFVEKCNKIFGETTLHYHKFDNIDAVPENPYEAGTIDDVLFRKTGSTPCSGTWRTLSATQPSTPSRHSR